MNGYKPWLRHRTHGRLTHGSRLDPVHLLLKTPYRFIMSPSNTKFSALTVKVPNGHPQTSRLTSHPRAYLGRDLVRRRPASSGASATSRVSQNISDAQSPREIEKEWFEGSTPGLGEARRGPSVTIMAAPRCAAFDPRSVRKGPPFGSRNGLEIS